MSHSLSVLLPVHNTQATLENKVEEILDVLPELTQDFELIIIDDGSTDATIEVADELAHRYPQVRAVRHGESQGPAGAVQHGMAYSSGSVICLQDNAHEVPLEQIHSVWRALGRGQRGLKIVDRKGNEDAGMRVMRPTAEGFQVQQRIDPERTDRTDEDRPAAAPATRPDATKPAKPNFLARLARFAKGE